MDEDFLHKKLNERKEQNAFRTLRLPEGKIDFCSNDYLGIVRNGLLQNPNPQTINYKSGSTGSRLLAGNYPLIEETEKFIASFHNAEAALIFNSGYDANLGLLSSIGQRGDTILYDHLSHASIRDGIRLSFAQSFSFEHNDPEDLEYKIKQSTGNVFVVTESVFSMDGDICPLEELISLCEKYNADIIIDEAHATGVIGEKGEGLVQLLGLGKKCLARMHSFGKACGVHGAVVIGSETMRNYLINFARSFIYSTALPEQAVEHIRNSYQLFPALKKEREHLSTLIIQFQKANLPFEKIQSATPIQGVIVPGNKNVKKVADQLQQKNLDVRPIVYPTVPKNKERLRIVLHAHNTLDEVKLLVENLKI